MTPGSTEAAEPDLDALLGRLDPDQLAAVTAPAGPVAVLAGAGSGKTRVLTTRIAYRIVTGSARAAHVVAFTFTRQAAAELQRRLADLGAGREVVAGTFHGVAYRILRRRWEDRGRAEPPTLATNRLDVLSEMLEGDRRLASAVVGEIEWARARLVSPSDYPTAAMAGSRRPAVPTDRVAEVFAAYEAAKRRRRLLDYDDLLSECIAELARPGVADAMAWWHRHLHVDEFQDINPLQHAFLEALRHGGDDLFVVGDPAQAIYGWNGADPGLLDRLADSPLRPVVVRLPTNYRSTPEVVAAGDKVLAANRLTRAHRAARPSGAGVRTAGATDEADEARRIVALAAELRAPGAPWSTVAVLGRTHELLRQIAMAFERAGIPTRTVTRAGAPASSSASALLRAARGAPDTAALRTWAVDLAWPAEGEAATTDATGEIDLAGETAADLDGARHAVDVVRAFEVAGGGSGRTFASWAALNDIDRGPERDAVELVTMHAAKGREWPVVIVAGVDTVGFPAPAAPRSPTRAEEARLLYVAVTRAVDRLAITWAERRNGVNASRSPLLPAFDPSVEPDEPVPPPPELVRPRRPEPTVDPVAARLTYWRAKAAQAAGVPPSFVLDDAALARVVTARPTDVEALAAVDGVGPILARRFADRILPLISPPR